MGRPRIYCKCGCKEKVKSENIFIFGHHRRKDKYWNKLKIKYCACGCGNKVMGRKFIFGHFRHSKESMEKVSNSIRKGYEEGRVVWNKGKIWSDKTSKKISKTLKLYYVDNKPWNKGLTAKTDDRLAEYGRKISKTNKGYRHTKETCEKMSAKRKGENNPAWRGGISGLYKDYCEIFHMKEWRKMIFDRDKEKECWNDNCMKIGSRKVLHHINYNKKDCIPKNIIKICNRCHAKTNHNRRYWKKYYEDIMKRR